jgi:hypothetical protein
MGPRTAFAVLMLLLTARSLSGQPVRFEPLPSLGIDSLSGAVPVYYKGTSAATATELQQLMEACLARYQGQISGIPPVALAILDSVTWTRATGAPYGFPHSNPTLSPVPIFVPATAAAALFSGVVAPEQADRFFRLLALHELGHVLMFAAVGYDWSRGIRVTKVPGWYLELSAENFRLPCLSDRPADAALGITEEWLRSQRPAYTSFDDADHMHEKQTSDGRPYLNSPEYFKNIAWYQGVVTGASKLLIPRLGSGFLPLLREQWARPGDLGTEAILTDLSRSTPELRAWLRSLGAVP